MGTLDFGGISPLGINLPPKHVFGFRERPANPYRVSWRSVQGTKRKKEKRKKRKKEEKKQKARLGSTFAEVMGNGDVNDEPYSAHVKAIG